jgi:hypothetical protein
MLGLGNQLRRLIPISQKKRGESLQYPKADLSSGHAGEKLLERSHLTEQDGLGCMNVSKTPETELGENGPSIVACPLDARRKIEQRPTELLRDDAYVAEARDRSVRLETYERPYGHTGPGRECGQTQSSALSCSSQPLTDWLPFPGPARHSG